MTSGSQEFHRRLKDAFGAVVELPDHERAAAIDAHCGGDAALRRELEALLAHDAAPGHHVRTASSAMRDVLLDVAAGADGAAHRIPVRLGPYEIQGLLGEGGMGLVYEAQQEQPRRSVALKVLRPGFAGRQLLKRFRRETELLGRLQHPNIAQIFEAGTAPLVWDDTTESAPVPWFAMEFVHGRTLVEHCETLPVAEQIRLFLKVCEAVEHAHVHGIVHRDLKPGNILVDERGEPKVLDFGIARSVDANTATTAATEPGQVIGTLPYMSPEQLGGSTAITDPRSDVYALGVILYQMLSGRLPLDLTSSTVAEAVRAITHDDPPSLASLDRGLRGDLDTIVSKCLEKEASRRYASVSRLAEDLRSYLEHRPIVARPASTIYHIGKFARRHRAIVAGLSIAFAALSVATAASVVWALRASAAETNAQNQLEYAQRENTRSTQSFSLLVQMLTKFDPSKAKGREITLKEALDDALPALEASNAEVPEVQALVLASLGGTYRRFGELATAERLLRRSIELHQTVVDPLTLGEQEALGELVLTLQAGGRAREALPYAEAQVAQALAAYGPDSSRLLNPLNHLGLLQDDLGDFAQAEGTYRQAIGVLRKLGRVDDPAHAVTHVNLATALLQQGKDAEAAEIYAHALKLQRAALGPDAPLVAMNMNNLSFALRNVGRWPEALEQCEEALSIREKVLPERHLDRLASHTSMATMLLAFGRWDDALPHAEESFNGRAAVLGAASSATARAQSNLAGVLSAAGRHDEALAAARSSVATLRATLKPSHAQIGDGELVAARVALEAGQLDEARTSLDAALDVYRSSLSESHRSFLTAARTLGLLQLAQGDAQTAVATLGGVLAKQRSTLDPRHPELAITLQDLALAQLGAKDTAAAAKAADESAAIWASSNAAVPWRAAYARALAAKGRGDRAALDAALNDMRNDRAAPVEIVRIEAMR